MDSILEISRSLEAGIPVNVSSLAAGEIIDDLLCISDMEGRRLVVAGAKNQMVWLRMEKEAA